MKDPNIIYILNKGTHVLHKYNFSSCPSSKMTPDDFIEFDNPDVVIAYKVPGYVLCEKCFKDAIKKAKKI